MRQRKGFTMIETILAVAIGAMVLAVIFGVLGHVTLSFERTSDRQDAREKAHMALTTLRTSLMDAWHYTIEGEGTRMVYHTPRMEGSIELDAASGKLLFREPGQTSPRELISQGAVSFKIEALRPGYLRLELEVARREKTGRLASLGNLKSIEEVYLPAIGMRDPTIPFNRALEHEMAMAPSQ